MPLLEDFARRNYNYSRGPNGEFAVSHDGTTGGAGGYGVPWSRMFSTVFARLRMISACFLSSSSNHSWTTSKLGIWSPTCIPEWPSPSMILDTFDESMLQDRNTFFPRMEPIGPRNCRHINHSSRGTSVIPSILWFKNITVLLRGSSAPLSVVGQFWM